MEKKIGGFQNILEIFKKTAKITILNKLATSKNPIQIKRKI